MIDETGGNPLAMLELAGELTAEQLAGRFPLPRRLPVGRRVDVHFLAQVATLSPEARTVLLVAAACADDEPSTLWRAACTAGRGRRGGQCTLCAGDRVLGAAHRVPSSADPLGGV